MMLMRAVAIILLLLCARAYGHDEGEGGVGFFAGLLHPALGFDHFLAMLSVGILSAQIGGRAIWYVPLAFVSVMIVGGILGINGVYLPLVEFGIASSVFALGVALAADKHIATAWAMLFVGFFATFHGHAHGTEMPQIADPLFYSLGFVIGTAIIHLSGVFVGLGSRKFENGPMFLRFIGAGIAGIGLHILFGS